MHQKTQENKVLCTCTLPGIWVEIEPGLFKKEYNEGTAWIEARLNELTVNLKAKAHGNMGGIMMTVVTLYEVNVKADDKSAIEHAISIVENAISEFLKKAANHGVAD